jgi:malate dehydrogenase (oxaloacetate-decarboxylating)(NADP+)
MRARRSSRIRGSRRATTARANLVAVVTNGTAVLGLGNIGAMAGKPVMEGKGCLFKKFAGIDVFDIESVRPIRTAWSRSVAALEPTFGGINLEDIKAPECFYIERKLRERMKIPVFHDDQHGTGDRHRGRGAQRHQDRRQGHPQR